MGNRNFDDPDATSATAYANRILLLKLIEALELGGASELSATLARDLSQEIGKGSQSRVDAIFELAESLEAISEDVDRRFGYASKGSY